MDDSDVRPADVDEYRRQLESLSRSELVDMTRELKERCFTQCVDSFTGIGLSRSEDKCVANCIKKFALVSQRCTDRFSDHLSQLNAAFLIDDPPASLAAPSQ